MHSNIETCLSFFTLVLSKYFVRIDIISISVPPSTPRILGDRGKQLSNSLPVGPFKEGDPLTIQCVATGGERVRVLRNVTVPTVQPRLTLPILQASRPRVFSGTETTPSLTKPTLPMRRARCRTPWRSRGWTGATWARGTDAWPPTPTWAWPRRPGSPWTSCVSSDRASFDPAPPGTEPRGSDGMRCWEVFYVASLSLTQVAW